MCCCLSGACKLRGAFHRVGLRISGPKEDELQPYCRECSTAYTLGDVVYFTEDCNPKKCALECVKACPVNAFYFKRILPGVKSRRIHINDSCIHCGRCADNCPMKGLLKELKDNRVSRIHKMVEKLKKHNVDFLWVKGHSNNPENDKCDKMAFSASNSSNLIEDVGYMEDIL